MRNWILSIILGAIIFITGCDSTTEVNHDVDLQLVGVIIINEGNYGQGNGSLSLYSIEDSVVQNGVFRTINGRDLGDVVQSMAIKDSTGYIVVNNSNIVEVVDLKTFSSLGSIEFKNGESPRFMSIVDDDKAYVTNLWANSVSIIDLVTHSITGTIPVGLNPDAIIQAGQYIYVANSGFGMDNTVSVIDIYADQVVGNIRVGDYPAGFALNGDSELHVLCSGYSDFQNPENDTDGGIYVIDTKTNTVTDSLIISGHPSKFTIDKDGTGYYLDGFFGNVATYSTQTLQITNPQLITGSFYGIAVDNLNDRLFVLDPKFFAQEGELQIYDFSGQLIDRHEVGIGPGSVTFLFE